MNNKPILLLVLSAFAITLSSATEADTLPMCKDVGGVETDIHRAVFTTKVDNREPTNDLQQVPGDAGEIFLFTDVRKGKDTRVSHVWYEGDQRIAFANLRIGSGRWRTWSRLDGSLISGDTLHVDLIHNEQCLLLQLTLPGQNAGASATEESATSTNQSVSNTDSAEPDSTGQPEVEGEPTAESREKTKLNAKDYAESVKEAALHYRDAQHAKLAGDYDQAEIHLQNAIDSIPETSPSKKDLEHELAFDIPVLRLDAYILALDQIAANRVYEGLLEYTESHPDRESLNQQLAEYKLKIDAMD